MRVRAGVGCYPVLRLLCFLLPLAMWGDAQSYEGKNISLILFVPKEQPVDPAELFRILPVRRNTPLVLSTVREAIDRLYATGEYTDIQVDAESSGNGVILRFLTKNSWFIGRVSVDGPVKDPPNNGQLVNATRLQLGEAHTEDKVKQAVAGIAQLFESDGFFEAKIQPRYTYDARTQQVHVDFVVDSGKRAKYSLPDVKGDIKIPAAKVVSATRWKGWLGWRPVIHSRTQRGLERVRGIYQDRDRLMATVTLEEMSFDTDTRTATPTITIESGPMVDVKTVGAKISRGKLKRFVPIYEERTVDRDLLEEGKRNLRDYFQSEGYFEVEIEFKQQRVVNDKAAIDYIVNRGRRHKLVKVEIKGNRYFDTATIRERMYLSPTSFQFRRGRYSDSYRRRDEESIADMYRENGFRDVKVVSEAIDDYLGKTGDIAVTIQVEEGVQWRVSKLDVDGVNQLERERIIGVLTSVGGQPFSEFNVAVDRDSVLTQYFSEGFPGATFEWSSTPSANPNQVDLHYEISEGQRRFVRQVLTSGLETTQDRIVNRNILLNPGDPLSQPQMVETQRRLYDLGIFARVNMAIQNPEGEVQNKYVLYQMEEAKRYSITTGFGAQVGRIGGGQTSLESPAGNAGFSPRVSFDISRINFRGLGQTISFRSRLSNIQRRALVNYSIPRFRNTQGFNLSYTVLYDDSRDVRTFAAKRYEGSVQLSQKLTKANSAFYRFTYRRVGVSSLNISSFLIPLLSQPVRIGILSASFIQDRRDDPTESHKGIYNTIDVGLASGYLGSQANFTRFLGRNSSYHRVGKKLVVARSVNGGWLFPFRLKTAPPGLSGVPDIPLAERFFSGGGSTHRGFPENQAGPRDDGTGFPIGGQALLFHNTELRFPLIGDNIGGVLFHDAGNVYSSLDRISFRYKQPVHFDPVTNRDVFGFDYMVHAAGFGIRYRTPIGPVRVDLAYSPNSPRFFGCAATTGEDRFRCGAPNPADALPPRRERISRFQFHFSIGQSF